jgi:AraC-like DNA-binding protein
MPHVEHVVYAEGQVEVGAFRCSPARPDFRDAGQIRDHCVFVFPRTAVRIRHAGRAPFTADPGVVAFYNPRQPYARERLDPAGDRCEWFAVDPQAAAEAVREHDPAAAEHAGAPFRFTHGPSDPATYLAQRELFHALASAAGKGSADALAVEERVLSLLDRVLALAYRAWEGTRTEKGLRTRERAAAIRAGEFLALRFRDAVSLAEVAREAGLSRFRLCRAFRLATGRTLGAYREQLRLRASLDALGDGCGDLTGLALDLGYSSHSHFTASFRKAFALTPSHARALLCPRR